MFQRQCGDAFVSHAGTIRVLPHGLLHVLGCPYELQAVQTRERGDQALSSGTGRTAGEEMRRCTPISLAFKQRWCA